VDDWWREVFDIGDALWSSVTVRHPHGYLGDYEGWYVAWREGGVHVSAPSTADVDEVASLRDEPALSLQVTEFWQAFAHQRGLEIIGPSTHFYLDDDPDRGEPVTRLGPEHMGALRDEVRPEQWVEAGMADSPGCASGYSVMVGCLPLPSSMSGAEG
jgi:hypothetical protein